MSDSSDRKIDTLSEKVYRLEIENRNIIRYLAKLEHGISVEDVVWADGKMGTVSDVKLDLCYVLLSGDKASQPFRWDQIEKVGEPDGKFK